MAALTPTALAVHPLKGGVSSSKLPLAKANDRVGIERSTKRTTEKTTPELPHMRAKDIRPRPFRDRSQGSINLCHVLHHDMLVEKATRALVRCLPHAPVKIVIRHESLNGLGQSLLRPAEARRIPSRHGHSPRRSPC